MKKILIAIRNLIIGLILFAYLSFIIVISTLLLNRNEYGMTQFGDKALILVDKQVSNKKYKKGSLAIVQERDIKDLNPGDEIFVYQTNKKTKTVKVVIAEIGKINLEATSPYVVLENDGTAWGEEFIAGTIYKTYENLGSILLFIESKWVFFCLLIVPCFFILLYEIHLVIVTIRFGDEDEEEVYETEQKENYKSELESKNEEIEALMKQIKELKEKENSKEETTPKKTKTTTKKTETKNEEIKQEETKSKQKTPTKTKTKTEE